MKTIFRWKRLLNYLTTSFFCICLSSHNSRIARAMATKFSVVISWTVEQVYSISNFKNYKFFNLGFNLQYKYNDKLSGLLNQVITFLCSKIRLASCWNSCKNSKYNLFPLLFWLLNKSYKNSLLFTFVIWATLLNNVYSLLSPLKSILLCY